MANYFEKTIVVDKKKIFTEYLTDTIAPSLYHGFKRIYNDAMAMEAKYIEGTKIDPKIVNPGVLKIFQLYVVGLDKWSDSIVETETKWIRNKSGCADIFDDLIKAVMKSHIDVLIYSANKKTYKINAEKLHEKIEPKYFIHACYLECGKIFVHHPYLFYHDFSNAELKENERKIYQLIKVGIRNGIKHVLPMRKILTEYLNDDDVYEEDKEEEFLKIKNMLNNNHDEGGRMKLIESSESSVTNHFAELEGGIENQINGVCDLEELIYGVRPDDTVDVEIVDTNYKHKENTPQIIDQPEEEHLQNKTEHRVEKVDTPKAHTSENERKKETEQSTFVDDIDIFGKITKKGKRNSQSILSDAFNAVKNNSGGTDDDIAIVKNPQKKSEYSQENNKKETDDFFNKIAEI